MEEVVYEREDGFRIVRIDCYGHIHYTIDRGHGHVGHGYGFATYAEAKAALDTF